jgi:hypothetical protein
MYSLWSKQIQLILSRAVFEQNAVNFNVRVTE